MAFVGSCHLRELRFSIQSSPNMEPPSADVGRPSSAASVNTSQVLSHWEVTDWDSSFQKIYEDTLMQLQDAVTIAMENLEDSNCS